MGSALSPLIWYLRDARIARCRVTKWRVDAAQAWDIAGILCGLTARYSQWEMFELIKAGECHLLGAKIEIVR